MGCLLIYYCFTHIRCCFQVFFYPWPAHGQRQEDWTFKENSVKEVTDRGRNEAGTSQGLAMVMDVIADDKFWMHS